MGGRKQISLIYDYDVNWIGGTYYILNIIKAISSLPDEEKPELIIYHDRASNISDVEAIAYPYISFVAFKYNLSLPLRILNDISTLIIGKEIITIKLPSKKVKNFYYRPFLISDANIENFYCWIADLQDLYLPEFFKPRELKLRLNKYNRMVNEGVPIVFSSNTAKSDFDKFFPNNKNLKKVVRFVSISNTKFRSLSIDDLKRKYQIKDEYFITSNQFWKHKNHRVVIEAFKDIAKDYPNIQLVLTGKEHDYRNLSYADDLKSYVLNNGLKDRILFLGFIDRDEQLKLMSESLAIIQPSLFEGWSTIVEDAKFLKKTIICSDIPVHREQLPGSDLFFDPLNPLALRDKIDQILNLPLKDPVAYDNDAAILKFARTFVSIFDN